MKGSSSISCCVMLALFPAWRALADAPGPKHVMSLSMCTDDLLLELLPPERIASVTYYSRDPDNSQQWPQAAKVRINGGTVEEVVAEKPDLVLAGTYTTPAARALLKKLGFPLLEVPPAENFDQIRAVTRQVAHALGRDERGAALIAKMDSTLQQLAATKPAQTIRVAAWGEGGSIPGKGTLFDAILSAAGGVNVATSLDDQGYASFDVEQLIAARPDILAFAAHLTDTPGLNTDVAQHPLIRKLYGRRSVTYPGALFSCGVVESADAAVALRSSLQQAMRRGS
ncbi:MAG TPA: ABC transporter substrate-binding protein [Steroidobacteraceae bacterium]|jgi:iron complex transport system substrate-binding protein|nr:ABC transporter substrate-binding protein [Steroidobacteraceae bacterium]